MSYTKFKKDLEQGKKGERHVANFLKKQRQADKVSTAFAGKSHDFVLIYKDGREEAFETKTDFFAGTKSQNVYLEYQCSEKPSGLTATKSDFWSILIPARQIILVFCPKRMWNCLQESKFKKVRGGDRKATCGFLVPIEDFKKLEFVEVFETNTRLTNA